VATQAHITVVEDEADLAELLAYNLQRAGYQIRTVHDGVAAVESITKHPPDLIVLDLMLPRLSGTEVARQVRTNPRTATIPLLMLTARAAEVDQVAGFKAGADDYVTKPFSMPVLLARVEALLRRTKGPEASKPLQVGPLAADLAQHQISLDGRPLTLTLTEFRLLVALMRSRGRVLSRDDLVYTAMGPSVMVTARTIDVHIAAIRKKLGPHQEMVRTIRGVGYTLREGSIQKA
jgi:two-component system phosphate regulon response regulator PhoB